MLSTMQGEATLGSLLKRDLMPLSSQAFKGHDDHVAIVVWSPDGGTLASGSKDRTVKLWDSRTGVCLKTLEGHDYDVQSLAWFPDGFTLVSGSRWGMIKVWDVRSGACLRTHRDTDYQATYFTWSLNGTTLVSWSKSIYPLRVWDAGYEKCVQVIRRTEEVGIGSVALSPDGSTLTIGNDFGGTIEFWSVRHGEYQHTKTLEGHHGFVKSVAWSPDGSTLASSYKWTIGLWDAEGTCIQTMRRGRGSPSLAWSPNGCIFAASGLKLNIWSAKTGECLRTLEGHGCFAHVEWSPDGDSLVSGSISGKVVLWHM